MTTERLFRQVGSFYQGNQRISGHNRVANPPARRNSNRHKRQHPYVVFFRQPANEERRELALERIPRRWNLDSASARLRSGPPRPPPSQRMESNDEKPRPKYPDCQRTWRTGAVRDAVQGPCGKMGKCLAVS